ncbi:MAG: DNA/RNA nuclease SfsA [Paracoccaceae bacterium]
MKFQNKLVPGTLIRRYKRFLADVDLDDGRRVVAHCANPGAMTGLNAPGPRVWLDPNDDPGRKLRYGWRLSELAGGHWAGIDTMVPNKVVGEALRAGRIAALAAYSKVRAEVKYGQASRVDFLLSRYGLPDAYVEVKNVHLSREKGLAEFPDSPTVRGAKHLAELSEMVRQGHRAVMFYLVQRTDCSQFRLADDVDRNYAQAFARARSAGVEVLCYDTAIDTHGVELRRPVVVAI